MLMTHRPRHLAYLVCLLLGLIAGTAHAQPVPGAKDQYFTTSDHVRLHYLDAGPASAPCLVLVPGWTMPAWIFSPQIRAFSRNFHVIAFDPRGQGGSEIPPGGYNQTRRGEDIRDLLNHLGGRRVVIIGWSLGVLDTLAYIHIVGDARLAGLVLIDNSVGENPPPRPQPTRSAPAASLAAARRDFVAGMFLTRQSPSYLNALTAASLRLPQRDARALLDYDVPRSYWREAVLSAKIPLLYVVRPHLTGQAENLLAERPDTTIAIYPDAGHALFVDKAQRFNWAVARFLSRAVWPPSMQAQNEVAAAP
jgi:microsomal epoxide hydrolase